MDSFIAKSSQNLFDVALQLYGSIEGLFDLLISNPDLNMNSTLKAGESYFYHKEFILNDSVVNELKAQNITPSTGSRNIHFKKPTSDLLVIVAISPEVKYTSFKASGAGPLQIDWGDNSQLETFQLDNTLQTIGHYFDNEVETRRIRVYGNNHVTTLTHLDTTELDGGLMMCRPLIVDEFTCVGSKFALTGVALFNGTYKVDLTRGEIDNLLPLGDMSLQELDLTDVHFIDPDALDDYLEYIVNNHNDRRPCTVWLTTEPSERGYAAIDTILKEPEWNMSSTWKFYINEQLYIPENGENS